MLRISIPICIGIVVGILYTFVYYNSLPRVQHNCCTVAIVIVPRSFCNNFWSWAAPYLYTYCIIIILLCTVVTNIKCVEFNITAATRDYRLLGKITQVFFFFLTRVLLINKSVWNKEFFGKSQKKAARIENATVPAPVCVYTSRRIVLTKNLTANRLLQDYLYVFIISS